MMTIFNKLKKLCLVFFQKRLRIVNNKKSDNITLSVLQNAQGDVCGFLKFDQFYIAFEIKTRVLLCLDFREKTFFFKKCLVLP